MLGQLVHDVRPYRLFQAGRVELAELVMIAERLGILASGDWQKRPNGDAQS